MDNIMLSNAEIRFVNCYINSSKTLCSTLQLKEKVEFLLDGEIRKQNFIHVFPRELKALVISLTGFELDELKTQRVLSKLHSIHMDVEGMLDENGLSHTFRVTGIEFTEEVIDALASLAEVNGLSEDYIAERNKRVAKATAARAKAKIKAKASARAAAEAEAAEASETLAKLRAAAEAAQAAVDANPTPANKGKLTKARKALAAAQA